MGNNKHHYHYSLFTAHGSRSLVGAQRRQLLLWNLVGRKTSHWGTVYAHIYLYCILLLHQMLMTILIISVLAIAVTLRELWRSRPAYKHAVQEVHMPPPEFFRDAVGYPMAFDNCEFKDSSYLEEVQTGHHNYGLEESLLGTSAGRFNTPVERVENVQSVLFYKDPTLFDGKRFYQTFPMDVITLKYHALQDSLTLYIHKSNPEKYAILFKS